MVRELSEGKCPACVAAASVRSGLGWCGMPAGYVPDLLVSLRARGAERHGKRREKMSSGRNKKKPLDPDALGLWEGCDGAFYTAFGRCAVCGKSRGDHIAARRGDPKPKPAAPDALRPALRACRALSPIAGELRIVLTRGYRGIPLDHDNCVGGFKPLRDEIARILGRDDAEHKGIEWEYRQEPGAVCKVEIYQKMEKVKQ